MRLPGGVRDWLPPELRRKRAVEAALRGVFERWAYAEVQTPTFERFDVLETGLGDAFDDKVFLFNDRRGTQLALRPDMTTPIARLVSTRMREAPRPLRLAYVQPAFRYEEPQEGRTREFTQAGLELIGALSVDADAESLFTAIEALDALGLTDVRFDINHAAVIDGILGSQALEAGLARRAKLLIAQRNIVDLRETFAAAGRADAIEPLVKFAMMRGGREAIDAARDSCATHAGHAGLDRLSQILERAEGLGYASRIAVDFSLLRDLSYYTGFIFEGFAREVGFSLCGGGRYDELLPRFGLDTGAVGWSVSVERLLIALERRHAQAFGDAPAVDVLVSGSDVVAARERAAGRVVRIDFAHRGESDLLAEARRQRIPRVVISENGRVREIEVGA